MEKQQGKDSSTLASTSSQGITLEESSTEFASSSAVEESDNFKSEKFPSGAYSFLKTLRYAMELIWVMFPPILAMDLLKPGLDAK